MKHFFKNVLFDITSITVGIDITQNCPYHCEYCYARNERKYDTHNHMSFSDFKYIVDCILKTKFKVRLDLYGGEPTTHPQINEFLEYLYQKPKIEYVTVVTNGFKKLNLIHSPKLLVMLTYHAQQINEKTENNLLYNYSKYNSIIEIMRENDIDKIKRFIDKFKNLKNSNMQDISMSYINNQVYKDIIFDIENETQFIDNNNQYRLIDMYNGNYERSFIGYKCVLNDFSIWFNGDIHRCNFKIENIFKNSDYFKTVEIIQNCNFSKCPNDSCLSCLKFKYESSC